MLFGSFYFRATRTIDGLMFLRERRFDAGRLKNFPAPPNGCGWRFRRIIAGAGTRSKSRATSHAS